MRCSYAVHCGVHVGKSDHHCVALTAVGSRVFDLMLKSGELYRTPPAQAA